MLSSEFVLAVLFFISIIAILELVGDLSNIKVKKIVILIVSIMLIGWIDMLSLFLLFVYSTLIIILIKKKISVFKKYLVTFVVLNVFLLILIKDYYLLIDTKVIYVPLGVSYYFFRLISFFIEETKSFGSRQEKTFLDYYTYVFFFPIFLAGPIQRYNDFFTIDKKEQKKKKNKNYFILFASLILKLLIIDNLLYELAYIDLYSNILAELEKDKIIFLNLYLFGFVSFIHAYFDLMIYTEISKSVSGILGFSKQENFNKPLLATNISMFWQSWHMSLSNWTRDYVFFPTLIKTKKIWLSTYASMMMIGIWHSISFAWLFWAFAHGSALNLYLYMKGTHFFKFVASNKSGNYFLKITGNITTISFVSLVFVVVALKDNETIVNLLAVILHSINEGVTDLWGYFY